MWSSVVSKIGRKSESYIAILKVLPGINKGSVYLSVAGVKRYPSVILSLSYALSLSLCLILMSTMTARKADQLSVATSFTWNHKSSSVLFYGHLQRQSLAKATIFSLGCLQSLWISRLVSSVHSASTLKERFPSPCWRILKLFLWERSNSEGPREFLANHCS